MMFSELWVGDRFTAYNELWTKIDADVARKHGKESRALGERGYGYVGDAVCSFERDDDVVFVPPNDSEAGLASAPGERQGNEPVTLCPVDEKVNGLCDWLEAAVAWEVCASIHEKFAKGKDALYATRHQDFLNHAENARKRANAERNGGASDAPYNYPG